MGSIVLWAVIIGAIYFFVKRSRTNNVVNLKPIIEIDGVIFKSISPETQSFKTEYDTGSFTTFHSGSTSTSYKNTSSYSSHYHYIKFVFQNTNDYPVDLFLTFEPYEEVIRDRDGIYKETYRDSPKCNRTDFPAKELGKVYLDLNITDPKRMHRPITLKSISVKHSRKSAWKHQEMNLLVKK